MPDDRNGWSRRAVLAAGGAAAGTLAAATAAPAETGGPAAWGAPIVEVHVPAGVLSLEQKSAMIEGVTDVVLAATGLPRDQPRKVWVEIFETAEGGWGVGGRVFVPRAR